MTLTTESVPPAISLLLGEIGEAATWKEARKKLRGLLPDLAAQSEAFLGREDSYKTVATSNDFAIHMHGALDLFTEDGCRFLPCRIKAVDRLARSIGLIADSVWITDSISSRFIDFGRSTNEKVDAVLDDVVVLSRLSPLIEAGIIRFSPSQARYCHGCFNKFVMNVDDIASELLPMFGREITVKKDKQIGYIIETGNCCDPPVIQVNDLLGRKPPKAAEAARDFINDQVRSALSVARNAAVSGGCIVSNSRVALAGLMQKDGRLVERGALLQMERDREISVPWVSSLTPAQVIQLRQEASKALPSFRNAMASALAYSGDSNSTAAKTRELIASLRSQADEVREELEVKQKQSTRYWKTTYALLGLGLSAYGVASDQAATGIAGMLPLIQLLIDHKSGEEERIERLKHRPSYLLVKAQKLLEHADADRA